MSAARRILMKELYELRRNVPLLVVFVLVPPVLLVLVGNLRVRPPVTRVVICADEGHATFEESDFADPAAVLEFLRDPITPRSRAVWSQLSVECRRALDAPALPNSVSPAAQRMFMSDLNESLSRPALYEGLRDASHFSSRSIPEGTAALISENRKLLRTAFEIHEDPSEQDRLLGLYEERDLPELERIASIMRADRDESARYIWHRLPENLRTVFEGTEVEQAVLPDAAKVLTEGLNSIAEEPSFYVEDVFSNPRAETQDFIRSEPAGDEIYKLNHWLLEESLETFLSRKLDSIRAIPSLDQVEEMFRQVEGVILVEAPRTCEPQSITSNSGADLALVWSGRWQAYVAGGTSPPRLREVSALATAFRLATEGYENESFVADASALAVAFATLKSAYGPVVTPVHGTGRDFSRVPGFVALMIVFVPFLLSAAAFTREKENGTLEPLLAIPGMTLPKLFVGKCLFAGLITQLTFLLLLATADFTFGLGIKTRLTGILLFEVLVSTISTVAGLGVSLWARSQLQSYLVSAVYLLSLVLFSGFLVPTQLGIRPVQWISHALPLTFALEPFEAWMFTGKSAFSGIQHWCPLCAQAACYAAFALVSAVRLRNRL